MSLGNGQTQRDAQFSERDCRCVGSYAREELFTLATTGYHWRGENFLTQYLKDLGTLRS